MTPKTVAVIVREALAEDKREGSHFDAEGFSNFCPEENPTDVREAWLLYERIVFGGELTSILGDRLGVSTTQFKEITKGRKLFKPAKA